MYVTIILSLSCPSASANGSRQHSYAVIQEIISQTRDGLRESIHKLESKSGEYVETISEAQTLADKLYEDFSLDVEKIDQAREAAVSKLFDTIGDSRDCKLCVGLFLMTQSKHSTVKAANKLHVFREQYSHLFMEQELSSQ